MPVPQPTSSAASPGFRRASPSTRASSIRWVAAPSCVTYRASLAAALSDNAAPPERRVAAAPRRPSIATGPRARLPERVHRAGGAFVHRLHERSALALRLPRTAPRDDFDLIALRARCDRNPTPPESRVQEDRARPPTQAAPSYGRRAWRPRQDSTWCGVLTVMRGRRTLARGGSRGKVFKPAAKRRFSGH
jgi:hypothetical protein